MKQKIMGFLVVIMTILAMPCAVLAEGEDIVTVTGLKEAVAEEISNFGSVDSYSEEINKLENTDLSSYSESTEKVNVYIFRGNTCSHCFDAIAYFASIAKDYGKYFNLRTYETWTNKANASLMTQVSSVMGDNATGVPYIVIGDKSYSGFGSSMADEILDQIKTEYASTDKYDVMDHLDEAKAKTKAKNDSTAVTIILVFIVIAGGIGLIVMVSKSK